MVGPQGLEPWSTAASPLIGQRSRPRVKDSHLTLCNVMLLIMLSCHWTACIWGLQATFSPLSSPP